MEESYREYYKTAFTAASVHPAEAAQEAQRTCAAICSLVGLRPPPPPTTKTAETTAPMDNGDSRGGGLGASEEGAEGDDGPGGEEVRTETSGGGSMFVKTIGGKRAV